MSDKLFTQALKTGDITVSSNVTCVTANGTRISRVEEIPGQEEKNPSNIYIDLKVQNPVKLHDVLEATEEVDLILNLNDAMELGLLMVAMGMEHKTNEAIEATLARLRQLIDKYR